MLVLNIISRALELFNLKISSLILFLSLKMDKATMILGKTLIHYPSHLVSCRRCVLEPVGSIHVCVDRVLQIICSC